MSDKKINPNQKRTDELDDFWDISSLIPTKKEKEPTNPTAANPVVGWDVSATEFELPPMTSTEVSSSSSACADSPFLFSQRTADLPIDSEPESITYVPTHPLIEQVVLHPWPKQFPYYARFCQTAKELSHVKGSPTTPVPFFSYMPQYDQMSRSQLDWYLYWRDSVRAGLYPKTGYSYIFLLIFEIINLPDEVPPVQGVSLLCQIWLHYREEYPMLDHYLSEWICDYCLLHQLPLPTAELGNAIKYLAEPCKFREFYVPVETHDTTSDMMVYVNCCSNYHYKKSRVYAKGGEVAEAFDRHIPAALGAVFDNLATSSDQSFFSLVHMQTSTQIRDTFVGALCSQRVKYKIEVTYRSFSRSHELRFLVTDIIKYSENKLRAAFGYQSRLSIYALPDAAKTVLNAYFANAFPKKAKEKSRTERFGIGRTDLANRADYERLYDTPSLSPMSAVEAERIEQDSWRTTRRLIEAFSEADADELPDVPKQDTTVKPCIDMPLGSTKTQKEISEKDEQFHKSVALHQANTEKLNFPDEYLPFLRAAARADGAAEREYCRSVSKMPETVADAINEVAFDLYGDILLEENEDGVFVLIEEYRDLISEMFENQ